MGMINGSAVANVATTGAIPAVLYYAVIAATVYFEACKRGLTPVATREIPRVRDIGREMLVLAIPLAALSYFLFMLYTPRYAWFWAIPTCLGVFFGFRLLYDRDLGLGGRVRDGVRRVVDGCREGAATAAVIGVLVAGSQIMVAVMGLTGVGLKFRGAVLAPSAALETGAGPPSGRKKG
jgi:TRAP-type uncharacterized transport system fused permease subunit